MAAGFDKFKDSLLRSHATLVLVAAVAVVGLLPHFGVGVDSLVLYDNPVRMAGRPWTIVSTAFVSLSWLQLIFNFTLLLVAGCIFENRAGSPATIKVFFAGILAGSLSFLAVGVFVGSHSVPVTLTGCSAGLYALAAALFRRHTTIAVGIAAAEISGLTGPNPAGSLAHLAGMATGFFLLQRKKAKGTDNTIKQSLLDKAQRSGYASLSADERELLRSYQRNPEK